VLPVSAATVADDHDPTTDGGRRTRMKRLHTIGTSL
jgi:hypothetical protein